MQALINNWFARHFQHVTPGTPDYAVLITAKDDLITTLTSATDPESLTDSTQGE